MDLLQHPRNQRRRIEKYVIVRFAIILMAIGLVAVYQAGIEPVQKEPAFRYLYTLLGTYLVVGLASLFGVSRWGDHRWFPPSQVAVDFMMGAILTGTTGGVVSVFCPILFVSLFSACTVVSLRGALVFAFLATALLTITTLGSARGWIPTRYLEMRLAFRDRQSNFLVTYLIAVGVALHVVAILGSQVSTGLLRIQSLQNQILEDMGEGLIAVGPDRRILQINSEARKILGIGDQPAAFGERLDEVLPEGFAAVHEAFGSDERRQRELDLKREDGRVSRVEMKVASVRDERGRFRCRVALFTDLSLKKEIEEAERRIHQLEELYEMSLGLAHEIRNPLASIRGCVQEIGRVQMAGEGCSRLVEIVCRESDRLDRTIEEFMCYTRKSARPTDPIDLALVAEETVILLRKHHRFQDRSIEFVRGVGPMEILGDREKLRQVVMNLGLNALASTRPKAGLVRISLSRQEFLGNVRGTGDGAWERLGVELRIEDNGAGIARENLDRIFTPFFTSTEGGSGLGLSIVQRIVHDHGGVIRVESEEGSGSSFLVLFPAHTPTGIEETRREVDVVA